MSTTTSTNADTNVQPGGTLGGRLPYTVGGRRPATYGQRDKLEPPEPRADRATGIGVRADTTESVTQPDGAKTTETTVETPYTVGGRLPARYGIGDPSTGELLSATDGFGIVIDNPARGGDRIFLTGGDVPPVAQGVPSLETDSFVSLDITLEANTMSDWRATVPTIHDLYRYPFSKVAIAHGGRRLFHGRVLPVGGNRDSQQIQIGGFGPLWELASGDIDFSASDEPAWKALNRLWTAVQRLTDGRVRGRAIEPPPGETVRIPPEGVTWTGTPMSVVKEAHDFAGMAFAPEHRRPDGFVTSFTPGTQSREAIWPSTAGGNVDLSPAGYHNRVTVRGKGNAKATVTAPAEEIEDLTGGLIIALPPIDDDRLETDAACRERALSELASQRANYGISGSLPTVPAVVTPGYRYRVPEFDDAAPEYLSPVSLPLRQVNYQWANEESSMDLSFEAKRGVVGVLRAQVSSAQPPLDTLDGRRSDDSNGEGDPATFGGAYPHEYP